MKIPAFSTAFALAAAGCLSLAGARSSRAQVEVTPIQPPTVIVPGQPVQQVPAVVTVQPVPTLAPVPGEHVIEIELAVSRGSLEAYFGRAPRREKLEIGGAEINIKMPSTATVTKIASRDKNSDGSKHVTPDNPWVVRASFNGPGRYVFNIVEWDDDPVVTAAVVKLDGAVIFSGRGSENDFNGWAQKSYAPNVNKTGSREIAFVLAD